MPDLNIHIEQFTADRLVAKCTQWDELPLPGSFVVFETKKGAQFYARVDGMENMGGDPPALKLSMALMQGTPDLNIEKVSTLSAAQYFNLLHEQDTADIPLTFQETCLDLNLSGQVVYLEPTEAGIHQQIIQSFQQAGMPLLILDPLGINLDNLSLEEIRLGPERQLSLQDIGASRFMDWVIQHLPQPVQKEASELLLSLVPATADFVPLQYFVSHPKLAKHPLSSAIQHQLYAFHSNFLIASAEQQAIMLDDSPSGRQINFSYYPPEMTPLAYEGLLRMAQKTHLTRDTQIVLVAPEICIEAAQEFLQRMNQRVFLLSNQKKPWTDYIMDSWEETTQWGVKGLAISGKVTSEIPLFLPFESPASELLETPREELTQIPVDKLPKPSDPPALSVTEKEEPAEAEPEWSDTSGLELSFDLPLSAEEFTPMEEVDKEEEEGTPFQEDRNLHADNQAETPPFSFPLPEPQTHFQRDEEDPSGFLSEDLPEESEEIEEDLEIHWIPDQFESSHEADLSVLFGDTYELPKDGSLLGETLENPEEDKEGISTASDAFPALNLGELEPLGETPLGFSSLEAPPQLTEEALGNTPLEALKSATKQTPSQGTSQTPSDEDIVLDLNTLLHRETSATFEWEDDEPEEHVLQADSLPAIEDEPSEQPGSEIPAFAYGSDQEEEATVVLDELNLLSTNAKTLWEFDFSSLGDPNADQSGFHKLLQKEITNLTTEEEIIPILPQGDLDINMDLKSVELNQGLAPDLLETIHLKNLDTAKKDLDLHTEMETVVVPRSTEEPQENQDALEYLQQMMLGSGEPAELDLPPYKPELGLEMESPVMELPTLEESTPGEVTLEEVYSPPLVEEAVAVEEESFQDLPIYTLDTGPITDLSEPPQIPDSYEKQPLAEENPFQDLSFMEEESTDPDIAGLTIETDPSQSLQLDLGQKLSYVSGTPGDTLSSALGGLTLGDFAHWDQPETKAGAFDSSEENDFTPDTEEFPKITESDLAELKESLSALSQPSAEPPEALSDKPEIQNGDFGTPDEDSENETSFYKYAEKSANTGTQFVEPEGENEETSFYSHAGKGPSAEPSIPEEPSPPLNGPNAEHDLPELNPEQQTLDPAFNIKSLSEPEETLLASQETEYLPTGSEPDLFSFDASLDDSVSEEAASETPPLPESPSALSFLDSDTEEEPVVFHLQEDPPPPKPTPVMPGSDPLDMLYGDSVLELDMDFNINLNLQEASPVQDTPMSLEVAKPQPEPQPQTQKNMTDQDEEDDLSDFMTFYADPDATLPVLKNERSEASQPYKPGEHVYHQRYGQGVIRKVITLEGEQVILNINFEGVGKRLLDPGLTQLEKVS